MQSVAAYFGKEVLSEVAEETFYAAIPELRRAVGDRPVLRAMHFYAEDPPCQRGSRCVKRRPFRAVFTACAGIGQFVVYVPAKHLQRRTL